MTTMEEIKKIMMSFEEMGITEEQLEPLKIVIRRVEMKLPDLNGILWWMRCMEFHKAVHIRNNLKSFYSLACMKVPMHINMDVCFVYEEKPFFDCLSHFCQRECQENIIKYVGTVRRFPFLDKICSGFMKSVIMNESHNLLYVYPDYILPEDIQALISVRTESLFMFLWELSDKDVPYMDYLWELTGSDPHNGGKQSVLLYQKPVENPDKNPVYVCKPRELVIEDMFFGERSSETPSVLQYINSVIAGELSLKLMKIYYSSKDDFSLEEYIIKKDQFTVAEAENYYKKLGVLVFVAALFGCTDLHQDNIMPTNEGPVILAGECILTPNLMEEFDIRTSGIFEAHHNGLNAFAEPSISSFKISGAMTAEQVKDAMWNGFNAVQSLCDSKNICEELYKLFMKMIDIEPLIRVVPIDTSELATMVEQYYKSKERVIKATTGSLKKFNEDYEVVYGEYALENAVKLAIKYGDIQIFQIKLNKNSAMEFFVNEQRVGEIHKYSYDSFQKLFDNCLACLKKVSKKDFPLCQIPDAFPTVSIV